ncbi:MAG: hypothetical protein JSV23_04325 [Promethearchaeota archaeon]|nr:MAG: hypothetical protein JSV23_04325 [Candidatus Lokiarchaeota archaeon]
MVQVLDDREHKNSIILQEIILLEEIPIEEEEYKESVVVAEQKPQKRALLKLFNKAKYNAKYLQEMKSIESVRNKIHVRSHAVY